MVEQYNNYSINNIPVNGRATQVRGDITGTLLVTVTIKTTGGFYVRIYIYFYNSAVRADDISTG